MSSTNLNNSAEAGTDVWLAAVKDEVAALRFGTVQVVVHEGEVVQIERVSRRRLGLEAWASRNPVAPAKSIPLGK